MTSTVPYYKTSVGRKVIVAVSGISLMLFLIAHMSGNLLLLKPDGGAAFDAYAHFMKTTPIVYVAELGLFAFILLHIVLTLSLTGQNAKARGTVGYAVNKNQGTFFSRYMAHTGVLFLIFLVIHLYSFFFQHKVMSWLTGAPAAGMPESLYLAAKMKFEQPLFSLFYVFSMGILAFHLTHGFWSAFQTLGWVVTKRIEQRLKVVAVVFAVAIAAGFAIIPLYFLIKS